MNIAIAGGGAAGFFAAIQCRTRFPGTQVTILEKSRRPLAKVLLSGGGRCNLTHACLDPRDFAAHYPRGQKELIGPLSTWGVQSTMEWFEAHGVPLKTELDGRVFPKSDSSRTVVECLLREAERAGVQLRTGAALVAARGRQDGFALDLTDGSALDCSRLLLATGGGAGSGGYNSAAALGHTIREPVPSLFSFTTRDTRLRGLAGLSVPMTALRIPGTSLKHNGPLLVTHNGLSGPAVLGLSACGARELHEAGYRFELAVNWCADLRRDQLLRELASSRRAHPKGRVGNAPLAGLPLRLWASLIGAAGCPAGLRWAHLPDAQSERVLDQLLDTRLAVTGKRPNKEEFVTCGGVPMKEVDCRTLQSRICPGLFFAGEVLDVDGLTGGYNLQAAWTTGAIAGRNIGRA
ncbi:MAG: NAD(P)/FAD-dependent oxidoreductase [Kiritimatiellae bacterium]|nr:NAD(P)/FAD-dependent oxidoreductase [Kiritimatiellia bacterium]